MPTIKQAIRLIFGITRKEYARAILSRAFHMYESSLETMATVPDTTLAYQGAKLQSALADVYVELARVIARDNA